MITFGIHTYRAQINAMPCPPDKFQIVVTKQDRLMLGKIDCPIFKGYMWETDECSFGGGVRITYVLNRDKTPKRISVHDMILNSMAKVK